MAEVMELGWDKLQHQEDEASVAADDMLRRLTACQALSNEYRTNNAKNWY